MLLDFSDETRDRHLGAASACFPGPDYYTVLNWIHEIRRPATYIDIGVRSGGSLSIAKPPTVCVGIDPNPAMADPLPPATTLYRMTSDQFFGGSSPETALGTSGFELAFIDGLHLFEQALRDFINLETWAGPGALILIHDCLPLDDVTSARERTTQFYSGDTWKVIAALTQYRLDLRIATVPTAPTGLCMVTNLDSKSNLLNDRFEEITARFVDKDWSEYCGHPEYSAPRIKNEREAIQEWLDQLPAAEGARP